MDGYVLRYANGSYVHVDGYSGGYPYETTLDRATVFNSLDEAEGYNATNSWKDYDNPVFTVERLIRTTEPVERRTGKNLENLRRRA